MSSFVNMFAGIFSAQLITLLLSPVLSRIYTPADYGIYWSFVALVSLLGVGAAARYEFAIGLPKEDGEASAVAAGALMLCCCWALVLPLAFHTLESTAPDRIQETALGKLVAHAAWVGTGVALYGAIQVLNYWLTRRELFRNLAALKVAQAGLAGLFALTFSAWGASGWIMAYALSLMLTSLWAWRIAQSNHLSLHNMSLTRIRHALYRFRQFPRNALPAILDAGGNWLPVLFVSTAFAVDFAGQFAMSRQMLGAPLSLVTAAISPILYQKFTYRFQQGLQLSPSLSRYTTVLVLISVPAIPVTVIWGADLFALIFGEPWRQAGLISSVLIFSYVLRFVASALSIVLVSVGAMRTLSAWQVTNFSAIAIVCLMPHASPEAFLHAYVATEIALYSLYIGTSFWCANKHDRALPCAMSKVGRL